MGQITDKMEKVSERMQNAMSGEPKEGEMTKRIEQQTAKIPSIGFLGLAVISMIASATMAVLKKRDLANFIGLWAPSLLLIGVYNKLVKLQGSE